MSRKAPTFAQLIAYIGREADPHIGTEFSRNLYYSGPDEAAVAGQFLDNYRYLPKRKNGNALYHEVLVLEPQKHLNKTEVAQALHELAEQYCRQRAPYQMAWGRVHWDTEYPHIHLMISANEIRSPRRVRMERTYFAKVQRDLEIWRDENLPELKERRIYGREVRDERPKVTSKEGELVRRTKTPSTKQVVFQALEPVFTKTQTRVDLEEAIQAAGFELYQRGKSWGVIDQKTGRRHRLQTLGLLLAFERISERNSAPPQRPDHALVPKPRSKRDTRAAALLQDRERLAAQARDLLDGFDRDKEDGR